VPKQNAFAVRPGSKLRAWDEDWTVIDNNTLNRTITLENNSGYQKRVRYTAGQELMLRSIPFHKGG